MEDVLPEGKDSRRDRFKQQEDVVSGCLHHVLNEGVEGNFVQFESGDAVDTILPQMLGAPRAASRRLFTIHPDNDEAYGPLEQTLNRLDTRQWRRIRGADTRVLEKVQTLRVAFARLDAGRFLFGEELLHTLYPRMPKGGILLLENTRDETILQLERYLAERGGAAAMAMRWRLAGNSVGIQKIEPNSDVEIERYDYVPPGFSDPSLLRYFPWVEMVNPWTVGWQYLRPATPHIYRSDTRYDGPYFIGNASYEEAICLYQVARQFSGRRGLEIGSHFGWTSVHLQVAGLDMDYVDPAFTTLRQKQVSEALSLARPMGNWRFWPEESPRIIPEVAAADERPYAFVFIDGNHDGNAPLEDALAVEVFCAADAVIAFHDMASPDVARALSALSARGWSTCIFNTMQILGFAWRGDVGIPVHVPDPNTVSNYEPHLAQWALT